MTQTITVRTLRPSSESRPIAGVCAASSAKCFVSTGFNIGASIAPIMYGMLMDKGEPRAVFLCVRRRQLLNVTTVKFGFSHREAR
jgi:hypothetical protein